MGLNTHTCKIWGWNQLSAEIYKEKSHEPQISEKSFSDHVESKSPTTLRLATLKMKQKQGWTAKVNQILMQWKVMNASFAVTAFQTRFS